MCDPWWESFICANPAPFAYKNKLYYDKFGWEEGWGGGGGGGGGRRVGGGGGGGGGGGAGSCLLLPGLQALSRKNFVAYGSRWNYGLHIYNDL